MVEIRWIRMTLFVILLLLQFTAASGQTLSSVNTRNGDEVTLSCNNVIKNQVKCKSTTWFYNSSFVATSESPNPRSKTEWLVILGRINDNVISKAKSNRLGLTADCSLVIRDVSNEDVGRYTCRQFISERQQGPDAPVDLSVVNMDEIYGTDTVWLVCTVVSYDECEHRVEWLYEANTSDVEEDPHGCSNIVRFPTTRLNFHELPKCNVTDKKSGETLLCNFGPQPSCEKTVGRNNTSSPTKQVFPGWWRFIILGLATLITIVVAVHIWKRTKGNRTQMDDSAEGRVTYENVGEPSASVQLH